MGIIILEGYLVVPLLMGHNMDLNATTVMLACLFWHLVWGPTGLFLAMPLMAGLKAVLNSIPELQVWAELMSSGHDEPEPPHSFAPPASTNGQVPAPQPETGVHEETPPTR